MQVLVGLALVAAGAAGLIAMNLWTVPGVLSTAPRQCVASSQRGNPPGVPGASAGAGLVSSVSSGASGSSAVDRVGASDREVDGGAIVSGSLEAARGADEGEAVKVAESTTTSTDGTELPSIRFEPQVRALSSDMVGNARIIANYVSGNFAMKVTLIGHGDEGMSPDEYVDLGRRRALAVRNMLTSFGVKDARIGIALPVVEGGRVVANGVPSGSTEIRIEPRFGQPKRGGEYVP